MHLYIEYALPQFAGCRYTSAVLGFIGGEDIVDIQVYLNLLHGFIDPVFLEIVFGNRNGEGEKGCERNHDEGRYEGARNVASGVDSLNQNEHLNFFHFFNIYLCTQIGGLIISNKRKL